MKMSGVITITTDFGHQGPFVGVMKGVMLSRHPEVFIEHCFAIHTQDGVPLESYAESIRITGPEQVLLSTDFGQVTSDPFPEGTLRYAAALASLLEGKVSRVGFLAMFTGNGRRALGIA